MTRIGVVTFPGSLDDVDAQRAVRLAGAEPVALWHADAGLHDVDAVILPGGFSYGDYLRAGAIARFAPVMASIVDAARGGMPVLGICNGFQVLCEVHLLPGALTRNSHLHFRCRPQMLRVENNGTAWTNRYAEGQHIVIPVKNIDGCYVGDPKTLDALEAEGRVVARYATEPPADVGAGAPAGTTAAGGAAAPDAAAGGGLAGGAVLGEYGSPNGSQRDIAGVTNEAGNVVGMMPHPEHAVEALTGASADGLGVFASVLAHLTAGAPA